MKAEQIAREDCNMPEQNISDGPHSVTVETTPFGVQVFPGLFVGTQSDYESGLHLSTNDGRWGRQILEWAFIHAAKEPYHREFLGYTGRAAPKDDPEYLFARRGFRLALNLVDAPDPAYIPKVVIDAALAFIDEHGAKGRNVFIHCNMGVSRAPSIAFLWMATKGLFPDHQLNCALHGLTKKELRDSHDLKGICDCGGVSCAQKMEIFKSVKYPNFNPGDGMRGFLEKHWKGYMDGRA